MSENTVLCAINAVYGYLSEKYKGETLNKLCLQILELVDVYSFSYVKVKNYSYEEIQKKLSVLNERRVNRKNKGVYYTPLDVVNYIVDEVIKLIGESFGYKKVLDPTSGTGEFLLCVLERKLSLFNEITSDTVKNVLCSIYGNDINIDSVYISRIRLFLYVLENYGVEGCDSIEDILKSNITNNDAVESELDYGCRFDAVIGNPPYVESRKSGLKLKKDYGNIYANVLMNTALMLNENGVMGFVVPISYISTPRMSKIRNDLLNIVNEQYISSYADKPGCLFSGVHQKLCILIGRKGNKRNIYTSNYLYWSSDERKELFNNIATINHNYIYNECIPKFGTAYDLSVYEKVKCGNVSLLNLIDNGDNNVYMNMRLRYYVKAFRELHTGSEYKVYGFSSPLKADYFLCLVNSSLFWWFWTCISDGWHITNKEMTMFKVPIPFDMSMFSVLGRNLEQELERTKKYANTVQAEYFYKHKYCMNEIHKIDDVINKLYGLNDDENEYIKNFMLKYRTSDH